MKTFKYLIICIFLLMVQPAIASESPDTLNEETIKNFRYHLKYSGQIVTLKNGEYKTQLRPGNEEDIKNYISVKIEKYGIFKPNFSLPFAIVILSENFGGSGVFFEITALVNENGKIVQTNSIKLGDRVVVKDLKFQPGFVTFRDRERDSIYLSLLTHRETDPSCCPTKLEMLCFTLVRDENKEIKLLTCEEADIKYPLPVVKKPALYLYPTTNQKVKVVLLPKGRITKTIPKYKDKWIVSASPNGLIDNKYPYLFYEVELDSISLPKEGWIVKTSDLENWFNNNLPKLGLSHKEIKDFKEYWLNELKGYPYYKIRLLSQDFLDENMAVKINPKPDTFIRVIFYFEGTYDNKEKLKEPTIKIPARKGFSVVEWGGILKTSDKSDVKSPHYSFFAEEKGLLVLRSLSIENHKIKIRVNTNGCTDKNSINVIIKKSSKIDPKVPDYEITFVREKADNCKAFLPDGEVIEYDLKKDFNIEIPYTLKVNNPVIPFTKDDPYFTIVKVKEEVQEEIIKGEQGEFIRGAIQEMITDIRRDIKNATIYSIQQEIKRYKKSSEVEKVKKLENELHKIKQIKDEDFQIPEDFGGAKPNFEDLINLSFGPIYPCRAKQTEIIVDKKISVGDIVNVKGMTKSGPFYHVAGIRRDVLEKIQVGKTYKVSLCLVYKREYFGFIPNYYVYLAEINKE